MSLLLSHLLPHPHPINCQVHFYFQTQTFVPGYSREADALQKEKCSVAEGPEIEVKLG